MNIVTESTDYVKLNSSDGLTGGLVEIDFDELTVLNPMPAPVPTQSRHDILLTAAMAYAEHGLRIAPGYEPLFDNDGNLTGCSCEAWKRSKKYEQWLKSMHAQGKCKNKKYDPNFKCRTPGKHPRLSDWETQASNDPKQITEWWTKWPTANICLPAGINGLVTFDLDSYKEVYGDDIGLFTQADKETVTQISGGGGEHFYFQMPAGKAYTNANNTLPPGIDIRGMGGQTLVEPSKHPSGNLYQWEDGYSILDRTPKPLPAALQAILDAAQQNSTPAKAITFTTPTTDAPDLIRWKISKDIRELINNPPPVGQRSEADYRVCLSLVFAGATDDEILAVFQHNQIGTAGKYAEAGDVYLAHTIGKARAYAEAHPRPDISATVDNLLLYVQTHSFEPFMADEFLTLWTNPNTGAQKLIYVTDSTDTKIADAILCEMKDRQRLTINIGKKRLGKLAGVGCNTALKALTRLNGWLLDVTIDPIHGTRVALCDSARLHQTDPLLASALVFKRDPSGANDAKTPEINEYSPRKADEPFLNGTSKWVRERFKLIAQTMEITIEQAKQQDDLTSPGLGESSLRAVTALMRCGDMTAKELAEETGKKLSSIRTALRKMVQHGIVEAARASALESYTYSLVDNVWARIDEVAPNLRNYKTAARRENKRLESAQQWAQKGMDEAKAAKDIEQEHRIERRFAKLAKLRIPHLARLHPDLAPKDIERLAYEVAAYKRSPEVAQQVRDQRTEATAEHRDDVRMIHELANHAINQFVADGLRKPTTRMVVDAVMQFGTFEEPMVQQVVNTPSLVVFPEIKRS